MGDLTAKQRKFCIEYIKDFNGTQSAIRAGYSKDTAAVIASENLIKPNIREYLDLLANEITGNDLKIIIENVRFWEDTRDDVECSRTDRLKASDLLGKYKAMFTEKIDHSGGINIKVEIEDV